MNNSELLSSFTPLCLTLTDAGFAFHFVVLGMAGGGEFSGLEIKTQSILIVFPRRTIPELLASHGPTLILLVPMCGLPLPTLYPSSGYPKEVKTSPPFLGQQCLKPFCIPSQQF